MSKSSSEKKLSSHEKKEVRDMILQTVGKQKKTQAKSYAAAPNDVATRSAKAASERPSWQTLAGAYARNLMRPDMYIAPPPERGVSSRTVLARVKLRFTLASDENGRCIVMFTPKMWAQVTSSSTAQSSNGLGSLEIPPGFTYSTAPALRIPRSGHPLGKHRVPDETKAELDKKLKSKDKAGFKDIGSSTGWNFDGFFDQSSQMPQLFGYSSKYRPIGCSLKVEPNAAPVAFSGTSVSVQVPAEVGLPTTTSTSYSTMWTFEQIASLSQSVTQPAIDGVHMSLLPYEMSSRDFAPVKPSNMLIGLSGWDADALTMLLPNQPPTRKADGSVTYANLYENFDTGMGPVDIPESLSIGAAYTSLVNAQTAFSSAAAYNSASLYAQKPGWGYGIIAWEGLPANTVFGYAEYVCNFEVVPDENSLTFGSYQDAGTQNSQKAMDSVDQLMSHVSITGGNVSSSKPGTGVLSTIGDVLKGVATFGANLFSGEGGVSGLATSIGDSISGVAASAGLDLGAFGEMLPALIEGAVSLLGAL